MCHRRTGRSGISRGRSRNPSRSPPGNGARRKQARRGRTGLRTRHLSFVRIRYARMDAPPTLDRSAAPPAGADVAPGGRSPVPPRGITRRAVLIGLSLIPVVCIWNEYTEIVAEGTDLVAMSLIIAVVVLLFA